MSSQVFIRSLALCASITTSSACAVAQIPGGQRGGATPSDATAALGRRELTKEQQAAHVLSRLTFGARPGELDSVLALGVDRWIDEQLRPETIADSAVLAMLARIPSWNQSAEDAAKAPALSQSIAGLTIRKAIGARDSAAAKIDTARKPVTKADSVALQVERAKLQVASTALLVRSRAVFFVRGGPSEIQKGRTIRAEGSEQQLLEVMTDFWENHFSVYSGKMPGPTSLLTWDRDVIHPMALGKFRDLLGAVAHSPAMLFYLDNYLSTADSLHTTLAEQPAAQQAAVPAIQQARVSLVLGAVNPAVPRRSGINENYARELMELHTLGVDGGYTQQDVIEVARALTGWTIATPLATGTFRFEPAFHDADQKVVLGATLPAGRGIEDGEQVLDILARHPSTARYIARKLVIRFVSDVPPAALVDRAAATFTRTDGDIREVVRTIVTSPEFFAQAAFRAKVKTPSELVLSARRTLGVAVDTTVQTTQLVNQLGQPIFGHLTPEGWPDVASAWINSGSVFARVEFATKITSGKLPTFALEQSSAWSQLSPLTFDQQVDGVIRLLFGGQVSAETRKILLAARPSGTEMTTQNTSGALRELFMLALGSPEFQRR